MTLDNKINSLMDPMKNMKLSVIVNHTYSPIRVTADYRDARMGSMTERGTMEISVPDVDGQQGLFGRGIITIPSGRIDVDVCQNGWATVAAGGCDLEWTDGPENWQARITKGNINGFHVGARGEMTFLRKIAAARVSLIL